MKAKEKKKKLLANGKEPLSPKAARLLHKVQAIILEEPKRLAMSTFGAKFKPGSYVADPESNGLFGGNSAQTAPECGTVACIAGWVTLLSLSKQKLGFDPFKATYTKTQLQAFNRKIGGAEVIAQRMLKLTDSERHALFFISAWPENFKAAYRKSKTVEERAEILAGKGGRIEYFIETRS